jgi:hypothetical protein
MRTQTLLKGCLGVMFCIAVCGHAEQFESLATTNASVRLSPDAAEVARLVQAKASEEVVLSFIKTSPRRYELKTEEVAALKQMGVTPRMLTAMVNHDRLLDEQAAQPPAPAKPETKPAERRKTVSPKQSGGLVLLPAPRPAPRQPPLKREWTSSVVVEQSPPPPKLEWAPPSPGADYAWVPGNWTWRGGSWIWEGGRWKERPRPGATWVNGYWAQHGRSYIWIPGRWQ